MGDVLYHYFLCGLKISSAFYLDYPQVVFNEAELTILSVEALPDDDGLVMIESPVGVVACQGENIIYIIADDALSIEMIQLEIINTVLIEVLLKRHVICLHGCVLNKDEFTAGFMAPSGTGKSTLSAIMVKKGWTLLAEDLLLLTSEGGNISVIPSFSNIRLWQESIGNLGAQGYSKKPVANRPGKYILRPTVEPTGLLERYTLTHLYSLTRALGLQEIKIKELDKKEAFWALMKNTFFTQQHNSRLEKKRFELFDQLQKKISFKSARMPDGFGLLEESVNQLINDIYQ